MNYILDTHTLVHRLIEPARLSKRVRKILLNDANEFLVPTMALLEMQYLSEIGRISVDVSQALKGLSEAGSYQFLPFDESTLMATLKLTSTRDPFDRIILGHALSLSTKIITQDRWMQKNAPHLVVN